MPFVCLTIYVNIVCVSACLIVPELSENLIRFYNWSTICDMCLKNFLNYYVTLYICTDTIKNNYNYTVQIMPFFKLKLYMVLAYTFFESYIFKICNGFLYIYIYIYIYIVKGTTIWLFTTTLKIGSHGVMSNAIDLSVSSHHQLFLKWNGIAYSPTNGIKANVMSSSHRNVIVKEGLLEGPQFNSLPPL